MMSARWTVTVCLIPIITSSTATTAMYQSGAGLCVARRWLPQVPTWSPSGGARGACLVSVPNVQSLAAALLYCGLRVVALLRCTTVTALERCSAG